MRNFWRRAVFDRFEARADVVAFTFELVAIEALAAIDELAPPQGSYDRYQESLSQG